MEGKTAESTLACTTTPAEILVLQEIIERKTNTYIYDTLKRKQEAAGVGAPKLEPRPVQLESVQALLEDDDEREEDAAIVEALQRFQQVHQPGSDRGQDDAVQEFAVRREVREARHREEEERSRQYLLDLRIREQIAQAQQQSEAAHVPSSPVLTSSSGSAVGPRNTPEQHVEWNAQVAASYNMPTAFTATACPSSAVGPESTVAQNVGWSAQVAAGYMPTAFTAATCPIAFTATHPTAVSFLQSSSEPLRYSEPSSYYHGAKSSGKGARKGPYGGKKGSGKGYYKGQEICKEYARNNKRCTYAARTGDTRGCKFYHGTDEEMDASAARQGWDYRRYDGYELLCIYLWEKEHGTTHGGAARGLFA